MTFKVGDKIRRTANPVSGTPIGFETTVVEPVFDTGVGRVWYRDRYGYIFHGDAGSFELIQESPVRTVTRQEIIPGTYDGVSVKEQLPQSSQPGHVNVAIPPTHMDHDALTRAAAVLTALAGALRDEQ